jgi:hypothetical protein
MDCKHKRIKSVNGVVSCADCGEIFPDYFKTAVNRQNKAENTPADTGANKSTERKRPAKNAKQGGKTK